MAIVRTVLPRKGIIQPKHGDNYEADLDTNWELVDSLLQDSADVQAAVVAAGTVEAWLQDRSLCGVVSGFVLSTSATLTPGLSAGVLYTQGKRYAPASAPNPGAAPASTTTYLFYNSTTGFYYQASAVGANATDALIGNVTTNANAVTAVVQAAKLYGEIALAPSQPGNFTVQHYFGHTPKGLALRMTSGGAIWFQSPTDMDATNLYLVASDAAVTAKVQIW
jgi:hypothetical protein